MVKFEDSQTLTMLNGKSLRRFNFFFHMLGLFKCIYWKRMLRHLSVVLVIESIEFQKNFVDRQDYSCLMLLNAYRNEK